MRALVIALALLVPASAAAQEMAQPAPPPRPDWMWSLGVLVRSTDKDLGSGDALAELEDYGWDADAPVLAGFRGDLAYLNAPIVDVGVAWAWAKGGYAHHGGDQIAASSTELGVFARVHWVRPDFPIAPEPRVELGVARTRVDLRGARDSAVGTYLRAGVDVRFGNRKAAVVVGIDYTHASADTMLELPTGGLNVSVSFAWRHWPI